MISVNSGYGVNFGARFKKNPVPVEAKKMDEDFSVKNPWGEGELQGSKGDWKVKNLFNGEIYPCKADSFDYEHVEGDRYVTRQDKPVYVDAELPETDTIESAEGTEKTTRGDGMISMSVKKTQDSAPYPVPADFFMQAYSPTDEESQAVMEQLKAKMAASGYNAE